MKIKELKQILEAYGDSYDDNELVIPVFALGTLGPIPTVSTQSLTMGFDWEAGLAIISPEKKLRVIDKDEVEELKAKYDELSMKYYQVSKIKKENKRLKESISYAKQAIEDLREGHQEKAIIFLNTHR